jgi:hypothetical protein
MHSTRRSSSPTAPREASPAQERFWILQRLGGADAVALTVSLCVRLDGALPPSRIAAALRTIVTRHDVLRSRFRRLDGRLLVELVPPEAIPIELSGSHAEATLDDADALRAAQELAAQPFDLARGPLVRAQVVANGPVQAYLLLAVQHSVWDGWSTTVLLRELDACCKAGADEPAPLSTDYWAYAAQRRRWLEDGRGARELAYWRERLDGLATLAPLAHAAAHDTRIHRHHTRLGGALRERIEACARAHGATPFSVVAASLLLTLQRIGLGPQAALGVPHADRPERRFAPLIGCFLNTFVLRSSSARSFAQLVADTRDATFQALQHGALPFEQVVRAASPARGRVDAPLYQAVLAFQSYPQERTTVAGAEATLLAVPRTRGRIVPAFTISLDAPEPTLDLEWNGELALPAAVLTTRWLALLEQATAQPESSLASLACDPLSARHEPQASAG